MIRIAICDDNSEFLDKIKKYISDAFEQYTSDFEIFSYKSSAEFSGDNGAKDFDILFLDIDMPEKSGFDIAGEVRSRYSNCFIIFVTSYGELVYKSFDFQPFYFIRKNNTALFENDIYDVVSKLMEFMKQNKSIVIEDMTKGRVAFYYRDISYIHADNHDLFFYVNNIDEPLKIRGKMNDISEEYEKMDLVRIHRSFIVNLRHVNRIDMKIGTVYAGYNGKSVRLPAGKKYISELDKKYTEYLRATL